MVYSHGTQSVGYIIFCFITSVLTIFVTTQPYAAHDIHVVTYNDVSINVSMSNFVVTWKRPGVQLVFLLKWSSKETELGLELELT